MLYRFLRKAYPPILVRVYADRRFETFVLDTTPSTFARTYMEAIVAKILSNQNNPIISAGDYRFEPSKDSRLRPKGIVWEMHPID